MNSAYLIIGGNQGDRLVNIYKALHLIEKYVGDILKKSSIYQTAAWGNTSQPDFLNMVICIKTTLSPQKLLKQLIGIEQEMGRTRGSEKWQARIMDIDILFFNEEIVNDENLVIPHPYIPQRKFVLVPLQEIAPDYIHPVLNEDINMLINRCEDKLTVITYLRT